MADLRDFMRHKWVLPTDSSMQTGGSTGGGCKNCLLAGKQPAGSWMPEDAGTGAAVTKECSFVKAERARTMHAQSTHGSASPSMRTGDLATMLARTLEMWLLRLFGLWQQSSSTWRTDLGPGWSTRHHRRRMLPGQTVTAQPA